MYAEIIVGLELDDLVAEKVMGWERHGIDWRDRDGKWQANTHSYVDVREYQALAIWRPTESIQHALRVVEQMIRDGAAVHISHWDGNTCPDTIWEVCFPSPGFRGEASCHTIPLAICRAALRAKADAARPEAPVVAA